METIIVLAMHGSIPRDFPKKELAEFFKLHNQKENLKENKALFHRYQELERKMRQWPRNSKNDPYHEGALELAYSLSKETGLKVLVAFNEFCAPSLEEALEKAAQESREVIVVTPMMTRGGEHSEIEIPKAVKAAQKKYLQTKFTYIWPLETKEIAKFLSSQIKKHLKYLERGGTL